MQYDIDRLIEKWIRIRMETIEELNPLWSEAVGMVIDHVLADLRELKISGTEKGEE